MIHKDGVLEAELDRGFGDYTYGQTVIATFLDGEVWKIQLSYGSTLGGYAWHANLISPRGLEASLTPQVGMGPHTVAIVGAADAEMKQVGARFDLIVGGQTVGECVPVWKDSDAEAGITGRALVDGASAEIRRTALVLITLDHMNRYTTTPS